MAKGLCYMHYSRVRAGIIDMRPEKLPIVGWNWDKRPRKGKCTVGGCILQHYAKGYCHHHYNRFRKYGDPLFYPEEKLKIKTKCSVYGCMELAKSKGFCGLHYLRARRGVPNDRPKGVKGSLNHFWKGGRSQYLDHYKMKIMRKIVLNEENYKCFYCGSPADRVHHIDKSNWNHSRDNLHASCRSCNAKMRKNTTSSKYRKLYGLTIQEIAESLNISNSSVVNLHNMNLLRKKLMNKS